MLAASAAAICLCGAQGGKLRPCLAIDFAAVAGTPGQELCHAQINAHGGLTLPAQSAFALFYGGHKFGIAVVKGVSVFRGGPGGLPFLGCEEG